MACWQKVRIINKQEKIIDWAKRKIQNKDLARAMTYPFIALKYIFVGIHGYTISIKKKLKQRKIHFPKTKQNKRP